MALDNEKRKAISNIINKMGASEDEKKFLESSDTGVTADIHYTRTISTFLLTKQLEQSTDEIIKSNKNLADAENKHSKKMC